MKLGPWGTSVSDAVSDAGGAGFELQLPVALRHLKPNKCAASGVKLELSFEGAESLKNACGILVITPLFGGLVQKFESSGFRVVTSRSCDEESKYEFRRDQLKCVGKHIVSLGLYRGSASLLL